MFGWLFGRKSTVVEEVPAVAQTRHDRYADLDTRLAGSAAKTVMNGFFTRIRRLLHDLELQMNSEKADLLLEKKPIPAEWLDVNFSQVSEQLFRIEVLLETNVDKKMLQDMVTNTMGNVILPLLMKTKKTNWLWAFEDEAFSTQKTLSLL